MVGTDHKSALVGIKAWFLFSTKPLPEPMMTKLTDAYMLPGFSALIEYYTSINTLRPTQNGCHFADDIFKCIFLNENASIAIKISPQFVPKGPINNILALVQIMAWRRSGDKPLSEPMIVSLPMYIWVTRPLWVKTWDYEDIRLIMCVHSPVH